MRYDQTVFLFETVDLSEDWRAEPSLYDMDSIGSVHT